MDQGATEELPTRWTRLKAVWDIAMTRVEPGTEVPAMPPQFGEWAQSTSIASFFGTCYWGGREYLQIRKLGPYWPQQPGLSKGQIRKMITEENMRRIGRLSQQAIKGGLFFGGLSGLFVGVSLLSTIANGEKTLYDSVLAGAITGAASGLYVPNSPVGKLKSCLIGVSLGASMGFPIGWLQLWVEQKTGRDPKQAANIIPPEDSKYPQLGKDPVTAVIDKLEGDFK